MHIKNIILFLLLYYYFFDNTFTTIIEYCGLILFPFYCIFDFIFYQLTTDKKIHHILGVLTSLLLFLNKDEYKELTYFITNFEISTEVSTLLLIITEEINCVYKNNQVIYTTSTLMFISSFLYYRIYKFLEIQDRIIEIGFKVNFPFLYFICIFGLFYLNVFWSCLIIKKMFKFFLFNTKFNTAKFTRYLCSFTNFIYIPMLIYHVYYDYKPEYNFFYLTNIALSISSHIYHYSIYTYIEKNGIETKLEELSIIYKYFVDILCCHMNTYSFAYCFLNSIDQLWYISILSYVLLSCIFAHIAVIYLYSIPRIKSYNDLLIFLNIGIQYCIYTTLLEWKINYMSTWFFNSLLGIYLLLLINIIKPFYNMNHILLHLTSWFLLQNSYNFISSQK